MNVVGCVRTAGSGLIVKSAVGGEFWQPAVVGVNVDRLSQAVFVALRSSIVIRYWVPQSSPPTVSEFCVMLPIVAGGYALADAGSATNATVAESISATATVARESNVFMVLLSV